MVIIKIKQSVTPSIVNGRVQRVKVDESTRHKWVNNICLPYLSRVIGEICENSEDPDETLRNTLSFQGRLRLRGIQHL